MAHDENHAARHGPGQPDELLNVQYEPNHVNALGLAWISASQISIAAGECRNTTNAENIVLSGAVTVDITASGANGLDTGAEAAATWYAVHVIKDSADVLAVAGLLSLSAAAPTLPAGYDVFRRVGWVRNDSGSNIAEFVAEGNERNRRSLYTSSIVNAKVLSSGSATVLTEVSVANLIPSTAKHGILMCRQIGTPYAYVQRLNDANITMSFMPASQDWTMFPVSPTKSLWYKNASAGGDFNIYIMGWTESL